MRFRLCGDLDIPDWVLKEISILSQISAVKVRIISNEIVNHLKGKELDYEKVLKQSESSNLDASDVKAVVSVLSFIFNNAVKYNISDDLLTNELTQLGLPKEHSESITRVYTKTKSDLSETFEKKSLRLTKFDSFDWRIDYILSSSSLYDLNAPAVQIKLNTIKNYFSEDVNEQHSFEVNADKFRVLLDELKTARNLMENL